MSNKTSAPAEHNAAVITPAGRDQQAIEGTAQVEIARLMTLKYAVRLEATGMRHSSGKSMRKVACQVLGLKLSTSYDNVIGALAREIDKRLKQGLGLPS